MREDVYRRRDSLRLRGFDYSSRRIYFVTIVVSGRRKFFFDRRLAKAVVGRLEFLRESLRFKIYAYCLMPDHFHALIGLAETSKTLGDVCGAFKSLTTREYWRWYKGKIWQRQFFDHIIRNEEDFCETRIYTLKNPARKNLVDWPYTGAPDDFSE
jgi:REP element-mobilizing transposase RayT